MQRPKRKYNIGFAIFIGAFFAYTYAMLFSGQLPFYFKWLPEGDLGIFRQTSAEQIIRTQLREKTTSITLPDAGTYRIISEHSGLRARNLAIYSLSTNEEIPIKVLNVVDRAPYDTPLLQGQAIVEFKISEPGKYQFEVNDLDLNKIRPYITLFPDYTAQNRQLLLGVSAILLIIIGGFVWYKYYRPLTTKVEREQKRDKWNEFMDDNNENPQP